MEHGADWIALSFVQRPEDVAEARRLTGANGPALMAKIEKPAALERLDEIIELADGIMVARGDLGVELNPEEVPPLQKRIVEVTRRSGKPVVVATQMLESMIESPAPTRAEVSDVANAVYDGADAVMLSAETASGRWPVKTVEAMARICVAAENAAPRRRDDSRIETHFERVDEAVGMATAWTARHMHATAIVALTESGNTALMMSRSETQIPIYAMTVHERTRRKMAMCRGVYPVAFLPAETDALSVVKQAIEGLKYRGAVKQGDRVLVTKGDADGRGSTGGTNSMKIVTVA